MVAPLLPDELWELIRPHLPEHNRRFWGGRPPIDDRKALTGIIFVLKSGIPWEELPSKTSFFDRAEYMSIDDLW